MIVKSLHNHTIGDKSCYSEHKSVERLVLFRDSDMATRRTANLTPPASMRQGLPGKRPGGRVRRCSRAITPAAHRHRRPAPATTPQDVARTNFRQTSILAVVTAYCRGGFSLGRPSGKVQRMPHRGSIPSRITVLTRALTNRRGRSGCAFAGRTLLCTCGRNGCALGTAQIC